jgi:transcriptional regulator with XRE-family HTH domain
MAHMDDSTDPALACALRGLRRDRGSTQEDAAYKAGITVATLARIERGQASPRWTTVGRIISALGVSLAELVVAVEAARGSATTSWKALPPSVRSGRVTPPGTLSS